MAARLSIIVPTHDGEGLDTLFASLDGQLRPHDQVLVIGDTCDGELPEVERQVVQAGHTFYAHNAGHHCYGHCQINAGLAHATGDYLLFIDDDDCYPAGALDTVRRAIAAQVAPRPLIFQFWSRRHGRTLPPSHQIRESAIGGHAIVVPNIPDKLGRWGERYAGDYDWIVSTLQHWPDGPVWIDEVIACA